MKYHPLMQLDKQIQKMISSSDWWDEILTSSPPSFKSLFKLLNSWAKVSWVKWAGPDRTVLHYRTVDVLRCCLSRIKSKCRTPPNSFLKHLSII